MTITLTNIGNASNAGGASVVLAPGSNVPSGVHVFVATIENENGPVGTVTDNSNGVQYTKISSGFTVGTSVSTAAIFVLPAASNKSGILTSNNISYTKETGGDAGAITCWYVSGLTPAGKIFPDFFTFNGGTSSAPTATQTGVAATNGLLIGVVFWGTTTTTFTQDSTNAAYATPPTANTGEVTATCAVAGGSFVTTGSTVSTYAPTLGASSNWVDVLMVYNPGPPNPQAAEHFDIPPVGSKPLPGNINRTWAISRFSGLIGQDNLAVRHRYSLPKAPPRLEQTTTFTHKLGLELKSQDVMTAAFRKEHFELPQRPYPRAEQTWAYTDNIILELKSQDAMTAAFGKEHFDLTPKGPPPLVPNWTWQYNLNLIGKDQLPTGAHPNYDRPAVPPWYRDWAVNLQQTTLQVTVQLPFSQFDWPTPKGQPRNDQTWTWRYNPNLIGQDALFLRHIYNVPRAPPRLDQTWTQDYQFLLVTGQDRLPTGSASYALTPIGYPRKDQTWMWSYNYNLVGKDQLPLNVIIYDRPFVPPWYREWIFHQFVPFMSPVQIPFSQFDWPTPKGYSRQEQTWTWQYNLNLINQDALFLRHTYNVPQRQSWYRDWSQNLLTTTLFAVPQAPFAQFDWPLVRAYPRTDQTWSSWYNQNLINQDVLPPNRPIYDRPPVPSYYREWTFGPFIPYIVTSVPTPFAQFDWPPGRSYPRADQTWASWYNQNLINQDILPTGASRYDLAPRGYPPLIPNYIYYEPLQNYPGFGQQPFAQYDWPLPTLPAIQLQQRGFIFSLNPNLPPPVVTTNFEWIIRYRRRRRTGDQSVS
jgi:hypothetical protein